jgi:hypothetical protein
MIATVRQSPDACNDANERTQAHRGQTEGIVEPSHSHLCELKHLTTYICGKVNHLWKGKTGVASSLSAARWIRPQPQQAQDWANVSRPDKSNNVSQTHVYYWRGKQTLPVQPRHKYLMDGQVHMTGGRMNQSRCLCGSLFPTPATTPCPQDAGVKGRGLAGTEMTALRACSGHGLRHVGPKSVCGCDAQRNLHGRTDMTACFIPQGRDTRTSHLSRCRAASRRDVLHSP